MTHKRSGLVGSERSRRGHSRVTAPRLYRLDGGHVVLAPGAMSHRALADAWRGRHVTAIAVAPEAATAWQLAELGRAAQAFDRVVICASSAGAARRFARAVRAAGRTECHVAADAHRALRHCVDRMIPGGAIVYSGEDVDAASRILGEYGAVPMHDGASGIYLAPGAVTGELTAGRIQKEVFKHHEQELAVS